MGFMGLVVAGYAGLWGKLARLTQTTDHPRRFVRHVKGRTSQAVSDHWHDAVTDRRS